MLGKISLNYINTFRFKVIAALITVSIIPLILYMLTSNAFISKNLSDLEGKNMENKIEKAKNIVKVKTSQMGKLALIYGLWTDAYEKVPEKNTHWFTDNYSGWLHDHQDVDLVMVVSNNLEILDKYGVDNVGLSEILQNERISAMLNLSYDGKSPPNDYGLMEIHNQMYMVGACPILKNNGLGKSRGVVLIAKKVTPVMLNSIFHDYGYNMLVTFKDEIISSSIKNINLIEKHKIDFYRNNVSIVKASSSELIGKTSLWDVFGNSIGDLYIVESRDLFVTTLNVIFTNGFVILIISTFCILMLSILLRRNITQPIKSFENQIDQMEINRNLEYVNIDGSTEINILASSFNNMVDKIKFQESENEHLKRISITDSLTSLYNHRYFYEYTNERLSENCTNMSIIFFDIDHFRLINDNHSHVVGDEVLVNISKIINNALKNKGTLFRYGGEEFIALLEGCSRKEALDIAETIRIKIYSDENLQKNYSFLPISVSTGISSYPEDGFNIETLVSKADRAMYYSKKRGRNQCNLYNEKVEEFLSTHSYEFIKDEMMMKTVYALAAAIDAKDNYTEKHSESVTKYALELAERLNLTPKDKQVIRIGGMLHDCGKIGIPDDIIGKPDFLNDEEYSIIKKHPELGSSIIKYITSNPGIEACVRYHHERWDGNGYPEGLSGQSIPYYARIISIADSYHAMVSDRPYRKGLGNETAFEELRKNKGTQFDPELVEPFIEAVS